MQCSTPEERKKERQEREERPARGGEAGQHWFSTQLPVQTARLSSSLHSRLKPLTAFEYSRTVLHSTLVREPVLTHTNNTYEEDAADVLVRFEAADLTRCK